MKEVLREIFGDRTVQLTGLTVVGLIIVLIVVVLTR